MTAGLRQMAVCCLLLAALTAGCAQDFNRIRQDQAEQWSADLESRTRAALAGRETLKLADCIGIALEHNLDIRAAAVAHEIAGLERKISFANFLPRVEAGGSQQWLRYQPTATLAGMAMPISDRRVRETAVSLQQPIFAPYTWFLYRIYRTGEEVQGLVLERTRQQIALQVTALFYHVLVLEEADRYLAAAIAQAGAVAHEVDQRYTFGLALESDVTGAQAMLLMRQRDRDANRRALQQVRSELLAAMGIDPFAALRLKAEDRPDPEKEGLADLVLEALLARPELQVRDRQYAIAEDRVKLAITAFLPTLSAFGALSATSDSFVRHQSQLAGGVNGVMTVFNGFANVNQYRAARKRSRAAFLRREQACLMVMLQVQQAWLNLQTAGQNSAVAEQLLLASRQQHREKEAAWQQQLIPLSDRLEAGAKLEQARLQAAAARYGLRVAAATMHDVLGRGANEKPDAAEPLQGDN